MDKPMKNIEEFYILGRPIETDIGILYPFKVKDYPEIMEHLGYITLSRGDIILWLKRIAKEDENVKILIELFKHITLYDFIIMFSSNEYEDTILYQFYDGYKKAFEYCFKEDVFDKVKTSDSFEYHINLIRKVNDIQYEETVPNENIQKRNEIKRKLQEAKGEGVNFEAMYTSVEVATGKDVGNMTLYQFNRAFSRIGQFKNYDTTVLYAMLSSEVDIEPWYKIFEDKASEKSFLTQKQLDDAIKNNGLTEKL